jgi:DNA repair protein SbcC/Rad50
MSPGLTMIRTLRIFNFQSHKNTTLDFHPNVNYIIGQSNSGKSAVIRALRWLWLNRPVGTAYISSFSKNKDCLVALETNKFSIIRERTKSKNAYQINNVLYEAFGSNPPEEVGSILDWDIVNLQTQREQAFLLADSPAKVSIYINQIVGLDLIDRSVAWLSKGLRAVLSEERDKLEVLGNLKETLAGFPDLKMIDKIVTDAERLYRAIIAMETKADKIVSLADRINEESERISYLNLQIKNNPAEKLISDHKNLESLYNKVKTLEGARAEWLVLHELSTKEVPDDIGEKDFFELNVLKTRK